MICGTVLTGTWLMMGQRNCDLMVNEAAPCLSCLSLLRTAVTALRTKTALRAKIALLVGKWHTVP